MVKSDEDGGEQAEGKAMTVVYLVSSFGFSGSPGEWTPWGRATEEYHRARKPAEPRRDGAAGFDCKIRYLGRSGSGPAPMGLCELL